jgi:hypothetical protein
MAVQPSAVRAKRSTGVILVGVIAVIIVAAVVAVAVIRSRSSSSSDLTGNWRAQQQGVTVDLTLKGSGDHLTGTFAAKNSPIPFSGAVNALVHGNTADVTVNVLGQSLKATCDVSNSRLVCTGHAGSSALTGTFTRP